MQLKANTQEKQVESPNVSDGNITGSRTFKEPAEYSKINRQKVVMACVSGHEDVD